MHIEIGRFTPTVPPIVAIPPTGTAAQVVADACAVSAALLA